jgi:hypothetical protein
LLGFSPPLCPWGRLGKRGMTPDFGPRRMEMLDFHKRLPHQEWNSIGSNSG